MTTTEYLIKTYGNITLTTKQLAEVLHMSVGGLRDAFNCGRLPIHTYKVASRRVADVRDVAEYLDHQRDSI